MTPTAHVSAALPLYVIPDTVSRIQKQKDICLFSIHTNELGPSLKILEKEADLNNILEQWTLESLEIDAVDHHHPVITQPIKLSTLRLSQDKYSRIDDYLEHLADTEVSDLHSTATSNHQIVRFDVPMNHILYIF